MKPPAWLKMSHPYMVDGKAMVDIEIRTWHPAFWRVMWGAMRQEIRLSGHNPNDPRMLWFVGRHLVKIIVRGK